jgi:hypothetical protein
VTGGERLPPVTCRSSIRYRPLPTSAPASTFTSGALLCFYFFAMLLFQMSRMIL